MRLHRLVLDNYRGVVHRAIGFPDHGVVVISGPNEIGKSSMIEALDLLLESRDRSTKREVKQVKPAHADVGAEVTAEISTGPYRFVYRKRFHKRPETELTVLAPHREQLTGDEAHDRVTAILAETVDVGLFRALRVLQAKSTDVVDLTGCDALSRALDVAAGDVASPTGAEPALMDRVDTEYGRYFTKTGRPTGEWAAATARLCTADAEVARCTAAVDEVDDHVARHVALTARLAESEQRCGAAEQRHDAARHAADRVDALNDELREARLQAEAAAVKGTASASAHAERLRLRTEIDTRGATIAGLVEEARQAESAAEAARAESDACGAASAEAAQAQNSAAQRVSTARAALRRVSGRQEIELLAAQLSRIDSVEAERGRVVAELAGITLTAAVLRVIEDAATAADRAEAQLAGVTAAVEITAAADVDLVIADQPVALPAGRSWSATAPVEIAVPGMLTVRVGTGSTAVDAQAKHVAAQHDLAVALEHAEVTDLATARAVDRRRQQLEGSRDQLTATLAGLCGTGEQADTLRNRLAGLRAAQPVDTEPTDLGCAAAQAELDAAEADHAESVSVCEARRAAAAAAQLRLSEALTRTTLLSEKLADQRAEAAAVAERLAAQQAAITDEALTAAADADAQAIRIADQRVVEISATLAAAEPDAVAAELAAAAAAAQSLRAERGGVGDELLKVGGALSVFGTEGRQSALDTAVADREHAAAECRRVGRRARAADLLRSVLSRHRDDTRQRYVDPFRAEMQRLGRQVFGADFEVEIDSNLSIRNRTLDGRTVPYQSLSGGAKEQLGILMRLAGAALVAKEDTVPVLIDDALGFTDPGRLAGMGAVFDAVGTHGQMVVLTCTPDRYRSVEGAHRIDLSR